MPKTRILGATSKETGEPVSDQEVGGIVANTARGLGRGLKKFLGGDPKGMVEEQDRTIGENRARASGVSKVDRAEDAALADVPSVEENREQIKKNGEQYFR